MENKNLRNMLAVDQMNRSFGRETGLNYSDAEKIRCLLSASRMLPSKLPWQQLLKWGKAHRITSTAW